MNDHLGRFQELLREIFQFDFADLDTGIYRLFRLREKELCLSFPKIRNA